MSKLIEFKSYGTYGTPVCVSAERITHFWQIDFNGNYGVEIQLDTGKTIRVAGWMSDVKKAIDRAMEDRADL